MAPEVTCAKKDSFKIEVHDVLPSDSGKYQIEKFLGEGSFGKVAQCVKLGSSEKMAVKIVHKKAAWSGKREVNMLRNLMALDLNKNNLVRFIEHFKCRGHICLAFEMLDVSLWDFMKERSYKPLCLSEIRVVAQQLLVALNALKSIGLVHADIKPDNVMLVNHQLQPFKLKLIDFGLANSASLMKRGTVVQALGYRAPEVILGLPLEEAIDMWALGCVLAFIYLGQHLYPEPCEYEIMRAIVQMQGQPDDRMLTSGIKTTVFFSKVQDFSGPSWRLKTRSEYNLATGSMTKPKFHMLSSLDDIVRLNEMKDSIEYEDTVAFVSLLKRMLHVDLEKRIIPKEGLGHRFITMKHFPSDTSNRPYVASAHLDIEACPLEKLSVEYKRFVTSSEVISWNGASISSLDDPHSAGETCATGPICRATADRTAAGNDNRPSGINDVVSLTSVNYSLVEVSSTSEDTSGFVEVKTREKYFKRIKRFFSRMMKRISCCHVDVVEGCYTTHPTLLKTR